MNMNPPSTSENKRVPPSSIKRRSDIQLKNMIHAGHPQSREALDEIRRRYGDRNEQALTKAVEAVLVEVQQRIAEIASMEIACELSKGWDAS